LYSRTSHLSELSNQPLPGLLKPIFEFFGFRKSQLKIDHCGLNCALFLFFFDLFLFVFPFALFAFPHFPLNSLRKASEKDLSNPATLKSSAILPPKANQLTFSATT